MKGDDHRDIHERTVRQSAAVSSPAAGGDGRPAGWWRCVSMLEPETASEKRYAPRPWSEQRKLMVQPPEIREQVIGAMLA